MLGAVRKIILRGIITTWIGVIWFRVGEDVIFVKRVVNILFWKEFRRVFVDELRKF
jgi:hypothetical protein